MRPNVIVIVLDTARADAFEPYGAPPGSSPTFAQLASAGGHATDFRSTACWTVPAHTSMFTGLLPRASGIMNISGPDTLPRLRPVLESHKERFLPEVLRQAGYETRAVSTNLWLTSASGFATGFDEFANVNSGRVAALDAAGRRERLLWNLEGLRARADDGAAEAESILARWTGEARDRPFFWFVNLIECHSPYLPPRPYDDLGLLDRWRAATDAREHLTLNAIWRACISGEAPPTEALERMRHLYAAAIRLMDDWLSRLLERLHKARLLGDTILLVLSDHGENFGESGLMGHAFSLDERLIRVPLACAGPGAGGVASATSMAELPRLIAGATGLEASPWDQTEVPRGISIAQFDPPTGPEHPNVELALGRWGLGNELAPRLTTKLTSASTGRFKLLRSGEEEKLFDTQADPLEEDALHPAAVPPEVLTRLRAALDHASNRDAGEVPPESAAAEISPEERQALEERMRLLGYM